MAVTKRKPAPMRVREYQPDVDYDLVRRWWLERESRYVRKEWLPQMGVVAEKNGKPLAMTWIYLTSCEAAQVAWTTTRPGLTPRLAYQAVSLVLRRAADVAKTLGVTYLHSFSNKPGLTRMMERIGWKRFDGYDFLVLAGGNHGH